MRGAWSPAEIIHFLCVFSELRKMSGFIRLVQATAIRSGKTTSRQSGIRKNTKNIRFYQVARLRMTKKDGHLWG